MEDVYDALDATIQVRIKHLKGNVLKKELGIVFEYTAPGTPQQNGVVERAFATMLGKTRAIMNGAGFYEKKDICFGQKQKTQ